jgi:hypothetical protein
MSPRMLQETLLEFIRYGILQKHGFLFQYYLVRKNLLIVVITNILDSNFEFYFKQ